MAGDSSPGHVEFDDQHPHTAERSRTQIRGLLRLIGNTPRDVLDLGCGEGRVLVPLAEAGHRVTGLDRDATALAACRRALGRAGKEAGLVKGDFINPRSFARVRIARGGLLSRKRFDVVLLLGNTFMTIWDVDRAVDVLRQARALLRPGAAFMIDDVCADFWPEMTGGNWQAGISSDGDLQMVWAASDAVFALRRGKSIDQRSWTFRRSDRRLRLWTDGTLHLAARIAGLKPPVRYPRWGLIAMHR